MDSLDGEDRERTHSIVSDSSSEYADSFATAAASLANSDVGEDFTYNPKQSFGRSMFTFLVFTAFVVSVPALLVLYCVVKFCRFVWLSRLTHKNAHLEIVKATTVRTAMDTYRSQGIVTVLLKIRGHINIQQVRQRIMDNVILKRNSSGKLRFPHMKMCLESCWGSYAWNKNTADFRIENHVIHAVNPIFRNRAVTSANIQEYVSEQITKYIPPFGNIPPWQLLIITTEPDVFYILARLHHLYISEDGINFTDLLMIKQEADWQPKTNVQDVDCIENILDSIFKKPQALPLLYEKISDIFSNSWNELVSNYDPLENPKILHQYDANLADFYIVIFIISFSILREYLRTGDFMALAKREITRRNVNVVFFLRCLIHTTYPAVFCNMILTILWWIIKGAFKFPVNLLYAMYETPTYLKMLLLVLRSLSEMIYLLRLLYTAPRILLEEIFLPLFQLPKHHLQRVSLSGRKVVSWTEPIPIEKIKYIRDKTGAASCEIELFGVSAALNEYFKRINAPIPETILTTTRFVPQENLLKSANRITSGLLCLYLPVNLPSEDPLYGLHQIQIALQDALTNQTALYLASLWQYDYGLLNTILPSFAMRVLLYILSARYSVMMTQIEAHTRQLEKKQLVWGQDVESFLYWRPPQANISLSLSLLTYGDEMRFAVMADAELAPQYSIIASTYLAKINQLAEEADAYLLPESDHDLIIN